MSYTDFLAGRGYRRVTVQRTEKRPGDVVLPSATSPVERVPDAARTVVAMRRKGGAV